MSFRLLPVSTLRRLQTLCDTGGAVAMQAALAQLSLAAGLYAGPVPVARRLCPKQDSMRPDQGVIPPRSGPTNPWRLVSFYRSYLTAADTDAIDALIGALAARV